MAPVLIVEDEGTDANAISTGSVADQDALLGAFAPNGENTPPGSPHVVWVIKRCGVGESYNFGDACRAFAATADYARITGNSHGPRAWSFHFCRAGAPT